MSSDNCPCCRRSQHELGIANRRIVELQNISGSPVLRKKFGLSRTEWTLFSLIFNAEHYAQSRGLLQAINGNAEDENDKQRFRVFISIIRRKMKVFGVSVLNEADVGYYILAVDKAKIRQILEIEASI